ncbi:hypothetical protein JD969_06435 [Planctomycetota bacterium]|nr:hypothetical protein JD969_06435 [Planctomycetota bacterium]
MMIAKAKPESFDDEPDDGVGDIGQMGGDGSQGGEVMQSDFDEPVKESGEVKEDDPLTHCSTDEHPELLPRQYDEPAHVEPLVDPKVLWEMAQENEVEGPLEDEVHCQSGYAFVDCEDGGGGGDVEKIKHVDDEPVVICPVCNVGGEEKNQAFYCPQCGMLLLGCCD